VRALAMSPGPDDGRRDGTRLHVGVVVGIGIAIVALGLIGRLGGTSLLPSEPPEPVTTLAPTAAPEPPDPRALLQVWQRPYAVTPDLGQYPSGRLTVSEGWLDLWTDLDGLATRSEILALDPGRLRIGAEAIVEGDAPAVACASSEAARYDWSITAQDTWLELTPTDPDPCPGRQARLAGQWVREARVVQGDLPAGIYRSQRFAPFGSEAERQVSVDLPAGWQLITDSATALAFFASDVGDGPQQAFIQLLAQPRVMAVPEPGARCETIGDAPGVGSGVDDIAVAIVNRSGVVATEQAPLVIDGYAARQLDLEVAPGWTGGCESPDGHVAIIPLLQVADVGGLGPGISIGPEQSVRLILVDLGSGRTLTIALATDGSSEPGSVAERVAGLMSIVATVQLRPPAP
jgi:hypothetical protein